MKEKEQLVLTMNDDNFKIKVYKNSTIKIIGKLGVDDLERLSEMTRSLDNVLKTQHPRLYRNQ